MVAIEINRKISRHIHTHIRTQRTVGNLWQSYRCWCVQTFVELFIFGGRRWFIEKMLRVSIAWNDTWFLGGNQLKCSFCFDIITNNNKKIYIESGSIQNEPTNIQLSGRVGTKDPVRAGVRSPITMIQSKNISYDSM